MRRFRSALQAGVGLKEEIEGVWVHNACAISQRLF